MTAEPPGPRPVRSRSRRLDRARRARRDGQHVDARLAAAGPRPDRRGRERLAVARPGRRAPPGLPAVRLPTRSRLRAAARWCSPRSRTCRSTPTGARSTPPRSSTPASTGLRRDPGRPGLRLVPRPGPARRRRHAGAGAPRPRRRRRPRRAAHGPRRCRRGDGRPCHGARDAGVRRGGAPGSGARAARAAGGHRRRARGDGGGQPGRTAGRARRAPRSMVCSDGWPRRRTSARRSTAWAAPPSTCSRRWAEPAVPTPRASPPGSTATSRRTRSPTHVAKYFRNALREDTLLRVCTGGIVFLPGAAGTVQEIFQDACENYYAEPDRRAPMVLVGERVLDRHLPRLAAARGAGRREGVRRRGVPRRLLGGCRRRPRAMSAPVRAQGQGRPTPGATRRRSGSGRPGVPGRAPRFAMRGGR